MSTTYTSYCKECNLAIEQGKDFFGLRHELFKLYHNHRYENHIVERYNDNRWIDKWLDKENEPKELYDERLGFLIDIPEWLDELIEKEIELWIKNESVKGNEIFRYQVEWKTEEDIIRETIKKNQFKLITENLNLFEYRLKLSMIEYKQYSEKSFRNIDLLPDKSLVIQTGHGEIIVSDYIKDVVVYAVRDYKRKWIATLQNDDIRKYGTEENPRLKDEVEK